MSRAKHVSLKNRKQLLGRNRNEKLDIGEAYGQKLSKRSFANTGSQKK